MNVLIACECSGLVRNAFILRGHNAISCDLEPTDRPGPHYQGDVLDILHKYKWDMLIGFPPCTHLAAIGRATFAKKRALGLQQNAVAFFKELFEAPVEKIALENPVGVIPRYYQKWTQIVQPYQFGEVFQKATCLWLKNLPPLYPTDVTEGRIKKAWHYNGSSHKDRAKITAEIPKGLAAAMAVQWG